MIRLRCCTLVVLSLAGCHFRAGFGPAPSGAPQVDRSVIRDTVETRDGGKRINETEKMTTTFEDGRSTILETVNVTTIQPDGTSSKTSSESKTERSRNGTISTSSSTGSSQ